MTSLESIRKRKALLGKSKEEYDAFREKWENVYYELGKKLQPDAKSFDDYGYWRLIEAVGHKNPTEFIKKQYDIEMSEEDMAKFNEMVNAIRTEYPARYFETKFERPLQLSDFTAAVVPNDIPIDVESRLKDAGVEVIEYEKGDNASRAEAMQKASAMEGVRFSLIGEVGATALDMAEEATIRMDNLAIARQMEERGDSALDIRMATGWERGADGLWRYELMDAEVNLYDGNETAIRKKIEVAEEEEKDFMQQSKADTKELRERTNTYLAEMREKYGVAEGEETDAMTEEEIAHLQSLTGKEIAFEDYKERRRSELYNRRMALEAQLAYVIVKNTDAPAMILTSRLGHVLKGEYADRLFKAYPSLKDMEFRFVTDIQQRAFAAYAIDGGKAYIELNVKKTPVNMVAPYLMHEVQHAIQHIEGFAEGGSPAFLNKKLADRLNVVTEQLEKLRAEGKTEEADALVKLNKGLAEAVINNDTDDYGNYQKLMGEVEARNVSARLNMSAEERMNTLLSETEDVAREDQIFLRDGVEMAMAEKKKSADETVSPKKSDHSTAISSADGAKILKKLDNLAKKYQEKPNRPHTFIGDVAEALGINMPNKSSKYGTYETISGDVVTIRLSNHNATASNLDAMGEDEAISIVVTNKPNNRLVNDGESHIIEFYYNSIALGKADGKPLVDIINSLKQTLYSGKYVDKTGLAEVQEINSRFSLITPEMDAAYLSAVGRGDMATAQQMVMEAAKLAMPNTKVVDENGNPKVVYHGSPNIFTVFNREKIGSSTDRGIWGNGFYFSESSEYAQTYAKRKGIEGRVLSLYLNLENPLFISLKNGGNDGAYYFKQLHRMHFTDEVYSDIENFEQNYAKAQKDLSNSLIIDGYDGVIVEYSHEGMANEYITFNPNQIKSADPVTYDDNGNVIPLSERFNPEKEDIRYSIMDADGNMIGDGSIHRPYNIVDFSNYPQIAHSVSKSTSTESVYVTYRNEETGDKAVVRFSGHNNNATRFGDQMVGWDNDSPYAKRKEDELKYRLGLMDKTLKYGTYIGTRSVSNADLESGKYEEADITLAELYALPAGTDISQHTGKLAKGSRELILGEVVKENRNKVVAIEYTPRFSLSEADVTLMGHAEYVKGLCELARGVYSITSPIVVAATKEDYAKTIEEAGYSSEDSETSFAVYLKNTDTIAVNAENIKEKPIFVESITHENAHSITKNLLWEDVGTIASSLDEEEIDALQKIALKGYDGYSPAEILDELISTFIQYFSTKQSGNLRLLDGYLKGYFNVDDLVNYMESVATNTYGERFAPIIKALMPVLKKNLEINKGKYERKEIGSGSATIRFDRDREAKKGNQRGVGEISGDIEGATTDTVYDSEAKTEEVDARYSIQAPEGAEEAYKASLLEEAMRMEREATSGGVDLAQEIADTTGWVRLANGVIVFDGLCNKIELFKHIEQLFVSLRSCSLYHQASRLDFYVLPEEDAVASLPVQRRAIYNLCRNRSPCRS